MKNIPLPKFAAITLAISLSVLAQPTVQADETSDLRNQVRTLEAKINQLQTQLAKQSMDYDDPFAQMKNMEQKMGHMMSEDMIDFNVREDIQQTPNEYVITMNIPGMDKNNMKVEVKDRMLNVSGQRQSESKEVQPNQGYRHESSMGRFYRSIALPKDAMVEGIDTKYNDGVLTIKLQRTQSKISK
jgi:HSP20 family protein